MTILLLQDLLNARARKQKELEFYSERKADLEVRLTAIRAELRLTDLILTLIKREELTEIGHGPNHQISPENP